MFWRKNIESNNKAVLITGCDSGFGNRLAFRLNDLGFRVYATVLDANNSGSQELTQKCKFRDKMIVLEMDVTDEQQINVCFDRVKSDLERDGYILWSVVNNAGYVSFGHLEWGSFDEYQKVFDVNVFGVVRVTRKFIPLIRESRGRIVLTASLGGRVTADRLGAYCMTKHAIISFSDALRREMRKFRVNVSTIEPGIFKTNMYYSILGSMEKNWKQTDESVRKVYGDLYFETQTKHLRRHPDVNQNQNLMSTGGHDLDIVINDMIDAIVSAGPKRKYTPVNGWLPSLLALFMPLTPQYIIDKYFYSLDNTVPAFMQK